MIIETKEIEVKVKIENFTSIENQLKKLGCKLSDPIVQNDVIFFERNYVNGPRNVLRIREVNGVSILTFKRGKTDELDCIEKEVEIKDSSSMEAIIELLGYIEYVRVNKKRKKCNYGDYEICLDEVGNLGKFIEVEKMSSEDGEIIKQELIDFLISLDVDISKRVFKGYDTLVKEKEN